MLPRRSHLRTDAAATGSTPRRIASLGNLPDRGATILNRTMHWALSWAQRAMPILALVAMAGVASPVDRARAQAVEVSARPESGVVMGGPLGEGMSALTGVVLDTATGLPVPGALVSLGRLGDQPHLKGAVCDSRGRFVFVELPAGTTYTLVARGNGYAESPYSTVGGRDGPARRPTEISLAANEWRQGVEMRLWRLGEISGSVLDEVGEPLVGVAVRAFTETTLHAKSYLAGSSVATTDDRGRYRLTELRPGSYLVAIISSQATVPDATPEVPQRRAIGALVTGGPPEPGTQTVSGPVLRTSTGHRLVVNSLALTSSDGVPRAYRPVFYPSAPSPAGAQRVLVKHGENREAVDFRLGVVKTFRLSGTVPGGVRAESAPLLRLLPRGVEELGIGNEIATTLVEANGSFAFVGVPAGEYTLVAHSGGMEFVSQTMTARMPDPAGFSGGSVGMGSLPGMPDLAILERTGPPATVWGRLAIDITDRDIDDVSLPLRPTLSIRGRVELEAGAVLPASQSQISVTAEPAHGNPTFGMRRGSAGRGSPADSFSVDGLQPGVYLLRGSYFPVRAVTWRGRDVTDVGIDASVGDDVDGVVVTLTAKGTELTGAVASSGGFRLGMAVIAFPADPALWSNYGWIPRRLRSVSVRSDGTYSLRNLPGGVYFVVAVEAGLADAWVDPLFLKAASLQASKVTLEWGGRATLDLVLRSGLRK